MPTAYSPNTTRPHWGGADQDVDQHLEKYDAILDTQFKYKSLFLQYSAQRTVEGETNTYRMDKMNTSEVKGRGSREDVVAQAVTSDKALIVVDCMMYIRNPIDWMDNWTAPDRLREMAENNGTQFAKAFDEAHVIRLIKARSYVAPAHLKPAFNDGLSIDVTLSANAGTEEALAANAQAMYTAIGKIVTEMTDRDAPLENMVAGIKPKRFEELLHHPKLLNKDFTANNGDFAARRVVMVQGLPVVQLTCFPKKVGNHVLSRPENGDNFKVSADDLKADIVIFDKTLSLVTVTAQPFTSDVWNDKKEMTKVLDCYSMWTVDTRRPDTVGVVLVTEA